MLSAKYVRLCLLLSIVVNILLLVWSHPKSSSSPKPDKTLHDTVPVVPLQKHLSTKNDTDITLPLEYRQIIFVGGVPRSGTTLMRAMLDAHPEIRCGEETRVIPRILAMRNRWDQSGKEHDRLVEAGMSQGLLDKATRAFINNIILGHGSPASFLCNKDPLSLNYITDILRLYPQAKFVLMIRDGRAVAHSIVSRNVTISGVNSRSYLSAAMFWNKVMIRMTRDCSLVGQRKCMEMYYEKLVRSPQEWMEKLLKFLDIPWHENVLRHEELINTEVSLSRLEPSSNQVKRPVNTDSLNKWQDKIPSDVQKTIYKDCDMLKELGYPPPPR